MLTEQLKMERIQVEKRKGAVCIVAYNRWEPLLELIKSLMISDISHYDLFVSIDYSPYQDKIIDEIYKHSFSDKIKIIRREVNLGLKKHVIACGDIVEDYDFIVILEDDLLISHFLNHYIDKCLESDLDKVASISLYSYRRSEGDLCLFSPKGGAGDNFFLQFPSSWGQLYTKEMWFSFKNWLKDNDCDMFYDANVPQYICNWPSSSWKKHYLRYMIKFDMYSLYPYFSMTTNPGLDGTHHRQVGKLWDIGLLEQNRNWEIISLSNSVTVYNSHFLTGDEVKSYSKAEIRKRKAELSGFIHIDYLFLLCLSIVSYFKRKFKL